MDRRDFISAGTAALGAGLANSVLSTARGKDLANDRITVAVVGVRGRGKSLLYSFAGLPTVDVKYVCDLDEKVLGTRLEELADKKKLRPEPIKDFRRALDDKAVDAIVLGTPDHWHAIPSIMACQAGKDVYVEKPDGHNLVEGQTMVAAAKKYQRIVQIGTQARSRRVMLEAIDYIRAGHLGRAVYAKAWESALQGSLGHPADGTPPAGVDYDLWLGPAPKRAFNPLRFHSNWRWFFDYGTGDLGNDGVHRLDMARWALDTAVTASGEPAMGDMPRSVSSIGGKYYFDDDQQWPDTLAVNYDFAGRVLTYEMRTWSRYTMEGESEGAAVYGDKGYIVIGNDSWRAYALRNKLVTEGKLSPGDDDNAAHAQNFIDSMRSRKKPSADLETVGHPSSALCHIGNVAWRVGRTVRFDPQTYTFFDDKDANQYLTRPEYRKPWTLPKISEV